MLVMSTKERVIMGPIKNQLRGVQSLGEVVGVSRASWAQPHWGPALRLGQRCGEESITTNCLVSPKGRRRKSWGVSEGWGWIGGEELGVREATFHPGTT